MTNIFNIKRPSFMNNINICDKECLRNRKLNELQQKYFNAKNQLESAPDLYEQCRKDYYMFKYGVNRYNAILEQEYKKEIKDEKDKLQNIFNEKYDKIVSNISILKELQSYSKIKSPTNSYLKYFLEGFEGINQTEEDLIAEKLSNQISLNSRKSYYELESYMNLKMYYYYYYIIYYICIVILFFLYIKKNDLSYYTKFFILIILFFYPIYIPYIINKLTILLQQIYNKLPIHYLTNL